MLFLLHGLKNDVPGLIESRQHAKPTRASAPHPFYRSKSLPNSNRSVATIQDLHGSAREVRGGDEGAEGSLGPYLSCGGKFFALSYGDHLFFAARRLAHAKKHAFSNRI